MHIKPDICGVARYVKFRICGGRVAPPTADSLFIAVVKCAPGLRRVILKQFAGVHVTNRDKSTGIIVICIIPVNVSGRATYRPVCQKRIYK